MAEKRLSEELRYCLERDGCSKCSCFETKSVFTCPGLLLKACEKIKEYEEMEEQGKLLKLPCTVGDTVYLIDDIDGEIERASATNIDIEYGNEIYIMISDGSQSSLSISFGVDDFGKTVFLTKSEAEQALKEMR